MEVKAEETIKKVVHQIRNNIQTKAITNVMVQIEGKSMQEKLIKVIHIATIVKNMVIMQVNVYEVRKIKKVM